MLYFEQYSTMYYLMYFMTYCKDIWETSIKIIYGKGGAIIV